MHFIQNITKLALALFAAHPLATVFAFVFIEEAGIPIPIPGDTLVMVAAAMPHRTLGYSIALIALSSLAVFLGSSILYSLARRGGRPLLDKYGRYIHLNQRRLTRMERWFERRGAIAIVLGRLIPGLRIPTTIMAGLSDVPYSVYAPTAAIAAVVWSLFYFALGAIFQHEWNVVSTVASGLLENISGSIVWIWLLLVLIGVGGGTWHARRHVHHARVQHMQALLHPRRKVDSRAAHPQSQ